MLFTKIAVAIAYNLLFHFYPGDTKNKIHPYKFTRVCQTKDLPTTVELNRLLPHDFIKQWIRTVQERW
jgi:hypothetical protein